MTTRPLGRTGFNASCIGFGDIADRNVPLEECVRTLHRAMDFGLNLIDTAPGYKSGYSEEIVGAALKEKRERMFVINIFSQSPKSWARASTINCPPWAVAVRASWRLRSTLERFLSKCRYFSRRRHPRVWRVCNFCGDPVELETKSRVRVGKTVGKKSAVVGKKTPSFKRR